MGLIGENDQKYQRHYNEVLHSKHSLFDDLLNLIATFTELILLLEIIRVYSDTAVSLKFKMNENIIVLVLINVRMLA